MMISGSIPSFREHNPQDLAQPYDAIEDILSLADPLLADPGGQTHTQTLLFNLFLLKEKLKQVQTLVSIAVSPNPIHQDSNSASSASSAALAGASTLVQDIIVAASSMMYAFQQLNQSLHYNNNNSSSSKAPTLVPARRDSADKQNELDNMACNIVELDADDLLAKFTHYCQVCGKGFKRDANLRMHMRAHGEEYKTSAALSNPEKIFRRPECTTRKYSCPHDGCRWNKNHAKFQPLKSKICAKNHYKRSHCPKMYVCNRCGRKQFSVLSDLRTHEKHCGDLRWRCSCGTTFSRKDKLMGHVALFVGHSPAAASQWRKQGEEEH